MIPWNKFTKTPCVCTHSAEDHYFDRTIGCSLCNCKKFHPQPGLRVVKKKERKQKNMRISYQNCGELVCGESNKLDANYAAGVRDALSYLKKMGLITDFVVRNDFVGIQETNAEIMTIVELKQGKINV